MTDLAFDNTYLRDLPGTFARLDPVPVTSPRLVALNRELAAELGLDPDALDSSAGAALFGGNELPDGAEPIAQAYAGHQFGSFTPQLGDGRALLLGEVITPSGERVDLVLKGSGRTPFSRGGDGRATLGPVLREFLMGEALHALGIPTTRALAAVATGEQVRRDRPLPGAVVTRVASSHLRVGTFQFFAARGDQERLAALVDYALARHGPGSDGNRPPALVLLDAVVARQARLVAEWMHAGFIHGVMNTDNTTISGETIDFGPCAFVDRFDPMAVFSSIDHGGRYAYGRQPGIAQWNLARLAETLVAQIDPDPDRAVELATTAVEAFRDEFDRAWVAIARRKLGLLDARDDDRDLASAFYDLLGEHRIDLTQAWRSLTDPCSFAALFPMPAVAAGWLGRYRSRRAADSGAATAPERIAATNPIVIPRNHVLEAALASAVDDDDLQPWEALLQAVRRPFDAPADPSWSEPAPDDFTATYQTFCGT